MKFHMLEKIRCVRDHMGKENTTISLMDWKIIMLDHKGFKLCKCFEVFQFSFYKSNRKNWSPRKYEVKGHNMHNLNQFIASQNLL